MKKCVYCIYSKHINLTSTMWIPHALHSMCIFILCAFHCVGCICLIFLHCVFSNVSSNCLHQRMHSHIGCICLTFLHCVFSNVSSNRLYVRMHSHIGCICWTFLHCAFSNVSSKRLHRRYKVTLTAFI